MDNKDVLSSILKNSKDIYYRTDAAGNIIWVSEAVVEMLGYGSVVELSGRNLVDDLYADPVQRKIFLERLNEHEKVMDFEVKLIRSDRSNILVSTNSHYYRDEDGNIAGIEGACRDITAHMLSERKIEGINRLKEQLISPGTIHEKLKLITDALVAIFNADFARIWVTNRGDICESGCFHADFKKRPHVCRNKDNCLWLMASSGRYAHIDGKVHKRVPYGCYKIGRVAAGEVHKFITNDVVNDPSVHDHEWAKRHGLVSFAGYRLLSGEGKPIGVMALFAKYAISPDEDALLEGIAGTTAQVIQATGAEDALRESEERWRMITESSLDIILLLDRDYNIQFINRTIGRAKEDVIGTSIFNFVSKKSVPNMKRSFEHVLKTGSPAKYEAEYIGNDGRVMDFEARVGPIMNSGRVTSLIINAMDVTERKYDEEKIRESKEKYRLLIDNYAGPIIVYDLEGNILLINEAGAGILSGRPEDFIGKSLEEIFPEMAQLFRIRDRQIIEDGEGIEFEDKLKLPSGEERWFLSNLQPVKDANEKIYAIQSISYDITGRRLAEDAVLNIAKGVSATIGERYFYSMVEHLSVMLKSDYAYIAEMSREKPGCIRTLALIADGKIVDNTEVSLAGMPCETVLNKKFASYPSDVRRLFPEARLMRELKVESYVGIKLTVSSGKMLGLMAVMFRKQIKNVKMVESMLKIFAARAAAEIERRQYEDALRKAKQEIEKWNEALEKRVRGKTMELMKSQARLLQSEKLSVMGQMAAGLAHELNSPLAGLLPLIEKYRDRAGNGSGKYRELSMMLKASEHMAKIIRDFGSFSREPGLEFEGISINDVIDDTLSFSSGRLNQSRVEIVKEYSQGLPVIYGDKTGLQQVVLNMMSNARDAMPDGGKLIIRTGVSSDNTLIIMEFIDSGLGIKNDYINKIFDPFFTTKKTGEGVGLGLSVSNVIVNNHGGDISVESVKGKGTKFAVSLPASNLREGTNA